MGQISGRQTAAARALADISQEDLADRARIPLAELLRMEAYGAAMLPSDLRVQAVRDVLGRRRVIKRRTTLRSIDRSL